MQSMEHGWARRQDPINVSLCSLLASPCLTYKMGAAVPLPRRVIGRWEGLCKWLSVECLPQGLALSATDLRVTVDGVLLLWETRRKEAESL